MTLLKKILVIPDLHEKDIWKRIVAEAGSVDKTIFLGDYVDSWTHDDKACLENLKEIIAYKILNKDKVELLLGNHDAGYLYYPRYACSGFHASMLLPLKLLLEQHLYLFKIAHQEGNYLFSHAGVSNKWLERHMPSIKAYGLDTLPIAEMLNKINETLLQPALYSFGEIRGGMRYDVGGPIWADKSETQNDFIPNIHQIVGHSKVPKIVKVNNPNTNASITYTDCLDKLIDYLVLEI